MHDYAILFLYHKKYDPVTWKHFALMQHHNPGAPIVPIIDGGINELPGTVDVHDFPSRWYTENLYHYPDTLLYRWFACRNLEAKRYVVVEYDVYCETSFPSFLSNVWDCPAVAHKYFPYEYWPRWNWFDYDLAHGNVPQYLSGWLAAMCPFGFLMFSHEALEVIVENAVPYKMFCETRIATACRRMGIPVTRMGNTEGIISWKPEHLRRSPHPAIYHPVKTMEYPH